MAQEVMNPETGEFTETVVQQSLAVALSRAEVDQQVSTAMAYPRGARKGGLRTIVNAITDLATLSDDAAAECVYALPRGGKPIKGPSVRLAEIVAGQYGNCRVGARVVHVDRFEKYVEAEGIFHDLESNTATTARVRRSIVDKSGRVFKDDMILVTGNAAASIAKRNAILGGVPKAMWSPAYDAAHAVIAGDIKTLAVKRDEAIKAFAIWGVKPEQIFAALEVGGLDDIGLDELGTLRAMFKAVKDGEQKVEEFFPAVVDQGKAVEVAKGTAAKLGNIAAQGKVKPTAPTGDKPEPDEAAQTADTGSEGAAGTETPAEDTTAARVGTSGEQQGSADQGGGVVDPDAPDAQDDEDAAPRFTAEQIDAAFDKGAEAKKVGRSRKATPPEWREPGFEPLIAAWLDGFDRATRE